LGSIDGFRDEDIAYAQRLLRAGVPFELHVLPGIPHGFDLLGDYAIARKSALNGDEWIRRQVRDVLCDPLALRVPLGVR
jgi:acetyl esterase/lipase